MAEEITTDKPLEKKQIHPKRCPICNIETNYVYRVRENTDKEDGYWYKCQCGVIFLEEYPKSPTISEDYYKLFGESKKAQEKFLHASRIYAPVIEELTYGRMMLDVGFALPYNMEFFEKRGWLTWGIETNDSVVKPGGNIYKGDFMTYDFNPHIPSNRLKELVGVDKVERTFDLIWMSHVLEHFLDPLAALRRCFDLLSDTGVLYLATPDIDFINKQGVAGWGHWRRKEHYIMWSEPALKRELERIGFKVIVSRRNYSTRFSTWWDLQMICQRNYF
jgi:SAM-dependent methyltransferase